jgi:hyperosmotically inducible protein
MKGTAMKISQLASLVVAGALVAPLAAQAADNKPEGTTRTWVKDSVVTTKIKTQLAASKVSSLATVHVDTDANGHVQLTGKVASQAEKDRAEAIAKAVEGVQSVDNQLTVTAK